MTETSWGRLVCAATVSAICAATAPLAAAQQDVNAVSQILGRPTDRSVTLSVLSSNDGDVLVEFGRARGSYDGKTPPVTAKTGEPALIEIANLRPDTRYYYRLQMRRSGEPAFRAGEECTFHTQRAPGSTFTFGLQGDSHPERAGKMYSAELYRQTMRNVAQDPPDFYLTLGDDFSIEQLISRKTLSQARVDQVYARQRPLLGLVGRSSPLFLVNGNHEQAARYLLDGTPNNAAVFAGLARTRFFPLPAPDAFFGGDAEIVEHIGLLRDYYSWSWGDALFVVIDLYWHSPGPVDTDAAASRPAADGNGHKGGGQRGRDLWDITLGETQYRWLVKTLGASQAKFKFVFTHHVLGTGRGGIEMAGGFEWGGRDRRGVPAFAARRPGWELPIHQLMVRSGVTILFQGHDHLFARQDLDGVVYQETPNPADPTYQAFNRSAYQSGDILPNSGHLRVTVAPTGVRVDYVRSFLPKDETNDAKNGTVAHTYSVPPRSTHAK